MGIAYHRARAWLPAGLRRVLRRLPGVAGIGRRLDPLRDPTFVWSLGPPLQGARFRIAEAAESQYVTGPYEPAVAATVARVVRPAMTCVDAGAHIGYMTLVMARASGQHGRVYAFEPGEANCSLLRENLALNGIANVVVVAAFVADRDGAAHLLRGPSSYEHRLAEGGGGDEIASVTLDRQLADVKVDFVKLDVEGADARAVEGMRRILARDRPIVLIEDHGPPTDDAKAILASHGYAFRPVDAAHALAVPADTSPGSPSPGSR